MSLAMDKERLMQVLLAPQVSEKSTFVGERNNQYVFRVAADATKPEIKAAVEGLFNVKVVAVNTVRQLGKTKRFRGRIGKRPALLVGEAAVASRTGVVKDMSGNSGNGGFPRSTGTCVNEPILPFLSALPHSPGA